MSMSRTVFGFRIGTLLLSLVGCLGAPRFCRGQSGVPGSQPTPLRDPKTNGRTAPLPMASRPGTGAGPTKVGVGIWLAELDSIDSAAQTFRASVAIVLTWRDPRLSHAEPGPKRYELAAVWNPRVCITNELDSVRATMPEIVEINSDGTAFYRQRLVGLFSQPLNLRAFPFDEHVLQLQLVAMGYGEDEVEFVPAEHLIARGIPNAAGVAASLSVPDWRVESREVKQVPYAAGFTARFAGYRFSFHAVRNYHHYIWKVIAPLMLVVAMSWTVFWAEPTDMGTQIGVSTTSMLTLIAYRFIIDAQVPRVPYMTRLDTFIVGSTTIVFLALVQAVVTTVLARRDRVPLARRIDRYSRVLFPLAFVTISAWSLAA